METVYDWLSLAIFAGNHRALPAAVVDGNPPDRMIDYLPPALGCAIANQLGNYGIDHENYLMHAAGIALLVAVVGYVVLVLKPKLK